MPSSLTFIAMLVDDQNPNGTSGYGHQLDLCLGQLGAVVDGQ